MVAYVSYIPRIFAVTKTEKAAYGNKKSMSKFLKMEFQVTLTI